MPQERKRSLSLNRKRLNWMVCHKADIAYSISRKNCGSRDIRWDRLPVRQAGWRESGSDKNHMEINLIMREGKSYDAL